jgi:hypothetical protein
MPKFAANFQDSKLAAPVRRYRNPNRHDNSFVYRSVTNVTGALPKMALLYWYAKVTAEAAVYQRDVWMNMRGNEKQTPEEEQLQWLKQAPDRTRDSAAAFGTTVHAVIERLLKGETYEVEGLSAAWVNSAERFVRELRPDVERLEASVYDERTLCAGTFDYLGRLAAAPELGRCLIDWKTSKNVYSDQAVQLVGGYLYGSQYILDDDGNEHEWQEPDNALIVHFTDKRYVIYCVPKDRIYRRAFLGALEIRKWEEDGPTMADCQLKLDLPASEEEKAVLRKRLFALSADQQLRLSAQCVELGINTKLPTMNVTDVDRISGLLGVYEMEDKPEPQPKARSRRPMA